MSKKVEVDANIVREFLLYDPHTGEFIWKPRRMEWFKSDKYWKTWNSRYANKTAGRVNKTTKGYHFISIRILGKDYVASKLAFLYMTGEWPEGLIGFANGDSLDLRISNIVQGAGAKGRRIFSNNKSGVCGVHWSKRDRRWIAQPGLDGQYHWLGSFKLIDDAEEAVKSFYAANNFFERHGQPVA